MDNGKIDEEGWRAQLAAFVRRAIDAEGVSYPELSDRLQKAGVDLKRNQLSNKVRRGSFSAAFLMQLFAALGVERDFVQKIARSKPVDKGAKE